MDEPKPKKTNRPLSSSSERPKESTEAGGRQKKLEARKWFESLEYVLEYVLKKEGSEQAPFFLDNLVERLRATGIEVPPTTTTPYVNTIPVEEEPAYPGDWQVETRIKSYLRWNAMAMVVNANRAHSGLGGHISTYASSATLYEVAYNHFFRGGDDGGSADIIYFQGHATPGNYARASLGRRCTDALSNPFPRESAKAGGPPPYPIRSLIPDSG